MALPACDKNGSGRLFWRPKENIHHGCQEESCEDGRASEGEGDAEEGEEGDAEEQRLIHRATMDLPLQALGVLAILVVGVIAFAVWMRRLSRAAPSAPTPNAVHATFQEREREEGQCVVGACRDDATRHNPRIVRDDGFWDLVRRTFGAQARLRLEDDLGTAPRFCESHYHLARQGYVLKLAELERARVERLRDEEREIGAYERVGAAAELERLLADDAAPPTVLTLVELAAPTAPAPLSLPPSSSSNGGTS